MGLADRRGEQLVCAVDHREMAEGDGTATPEPPRHTQRQPFYRGIQVGGANPWRFHRDRAIRTETVNAASERQGAVGIAGEVRVVERAGMAEPDGRASAGEVSARLIFLRLLAPASRQPNVLAARCYFDVRNMRLHAVLLCGIIYVMVALSSCSRGSVPAPTSDYEWNWPRPQDASHALGDSQTATTCRFKKAAGVGLDDTRHGINYWVAPEPETDTVSFSDLGTKTPRLAYRSIQTQLLVAGDVNGILTLVNQQSLGGIEVYVIDRKQALVVHSNLIPSLGTRGDIEMGYCQ